MKKTISMLLALLLTLLMGGCAEEVPEQPAVTESVVWEEALPLNHGVLEYEKLTPRPWYCGSLEFSGRCFWAGRENGYYYFDGGENTLYYADKTDLWNWVPVCNKPNCAHTFTVFGCNSHLGGHGFWIRDGRIYYPDISPTGKNQPMYLDVDRMIALVASRSLDGTDMRMDHVFEDVFAAGGGMIAPMAGTNWWLIETHALNPDGTKTGRLYMLTESGMEMIVERQIQEYGYLMGRDQFINGEYHDAYFGDDTFQLDLLAEDRGDPYFSLYRYAKGEIDLVDVAGYEDTGKYISGNTLRLYRENDGYYDLDLTTRQETFLCKAQLPDATAAILQPNCIIEYNGTVMRLFDGESWRTVRIPEELQGAPMTVEALASDRIFLVHNDWRMNNIELYQILFGEDELFLEYCGQMV